MSESIEMTTVRALPGTCLGICVMGVGHFDDDRTSHALGRLTIYDVFGDIANMSSWILG